MELYHQIENDLNNKDFSLYYYFEHEVAKTCAAYEKSGSKNYPNLLREIFDKYKVAYIESLNN